MVELFHKSSKDTQNDHQKLKLCKKTKWVVFWNTVYFC